jgi:Cu2+-containing amine oxidase
MVVPYGDPAWPHPRKVSCTFVSEFE